MGRITCALKSLSISRDITISSVELKIICLFVKYSGGTSSNSMSYPNWTIFKTQLSEVISSQLETCEEIFPPTKLSGKFLRSKILVDTTLTLLSLSSLAGNLSWMIFTVCGPLPGVSPSCENGPSCPKKTFALDFDQNSGQIHTSESDSACWSCKNEKVSYVQKYSASSS